MILAARAAAGILALAAVALIAGCDPEPPRATEPPLQFLEREPLTSCGEITLVQGEELPAENLACLAEAAQTGAEFAVTRPTTEGDPVTEYYRVLPGGGWEAYIDGTQDRFGGHWWYTDCPDAEAIGDLATCEGTRL